MLLYFHHESDPKKLLPVISEPFILYLAFTPMEENYDLIDFLQLERTIIYYDHVVERIWEDSPQGGAYLLKLIMGPGHVTKEKGKPCIKIEIPVYENYLRGASLAVTLAAVVGANLRAGGNLGKSDIKILPNYQAKVIYGIKGSPEALCLTEKSLAIQPPSLVFRALNYQAGDCINIAEIMQALGPESIYTLKQQGHHLTLKMFSAEHSRKLRVVLENTSLESLLGSNAFLTGNSPASEYEWLTYRYLDQQFIDDNAVNEADTLITSKTLLNAFLQEEDYASMKLFLENLSRGDY
jgi:hypothetical protein